MKIVEFVLTTDHIVTQLGASKILATWREADVQALEQPDMSDQVAVEQWLRCAAVVKPGTLTGTKVTQCKDVCKCAYCHARETTIEPWGKPVSVEVHHMVDAPACHCVAKNCWCCVDVS